MKKIAVLTCLLVIVSSAGCASLFKPTLKQRLVDLHQGDYRLDPKHSTILFKVDHMGFSKYVGRFNQFKASLFLDPLNIENSRLEAIVDMASVDVNDKKFERALKGRFWFRTEAYPQGLFKTLSAQKIDENHVMFLGELTFLGVPQTIELLVTINGAANNLLTGKYTLGFSASTRFSRSVFGLDKYVPAIGDEIELEIHAEFQKYSENYSE